MRSISNVPWKCVTFLGARGAEASQSASDGKMGQHGRPAVEDGSALVGWYKGRRPSVSVTCSHGNQMYFVMKTSPFSTVALFKMHLSLSHKEQNLCHHLFYPAVKIK